MQSSSDGRRRSGVCSAFPRIPLTNPPIVTHHDSMAKRAMYGLHTVTGQPTSSLAGRPFYVFWFMGQVLRLVPEVTSCFDN